MRSEEPTAVAGVAWAGGPRTVLVVDDDEPVREVVRAGLWQYGLAVVVAEDGREAVELFHGLMEQDEGESPAVLLDVRMPGLDGPLVLAALQSLDPGVLAYFMTGGPDPYTTDELLASGARRVFAKPLDFAAVAAELRRGAASPATSPARGGMR